MYCPKCGAPLAKENGRWSCTSGGLKLSRRFGERLEQQFAARYQAGRRTAGEMNFVAGLYCPSCGVPTTSDSCPECSQSLRAFIWELVELHPHADGKGGWR
ncbi:MAG: hypothetical protein H6707_10425 [Deltaproteobacteria bacterium]|nr:hypothetical protein [Deltaproteobacteria bacterium]